MRINEQIQAYSAMENGCPKEFTEESPQYGTPRYVVDPIN